MLKRTSFTLIIFLAGIATIVIASSIYFSGNSQLRSTSDQESKQKVMSDFDFLTAVKPVLDKRCVVCHACYDAPCQLKLGSYEGITRGANVERVYDGERLLEANLTRLFEDAHSTEAWRDKDFFPVINDKSSTESENIEQSVISQMLELKSQNPLPANKLLSEEFDLDLNRQYQCPTIEEFDAYKKDHPSWGMPYALPAITDDEQAILTGWIAQGANGTDSQLILPNNQEKLNNWESFLNQDNSKAQLMSRYLFEHLFLVNLYFDDSTARQYFKLVRSVSPPGTKVEGIYTRRPFDDPGVDRVFYRLTPVKETIAHKSHMPIELSNAKMQRWTELFIDAEFEVDKLPSYAPEKASNPFITFAQIPVQSRYKYMLDESHNTIMQFIKGPVCRGQMALNVINDHFWVVFVEPDLDLIENDNEFMQKARQKIRLPAEKQSNALPTSWLTYASMERKYLKAKSDYIEQHVQNKVAITLDLLWDGDGRNTNAALTVFRHKDAASVVKGLVGNSPQTTWVLTYSLFERIHYLLVAGYDVYGNVGHQLNSRMYMDFLRMEGEFNFLSLLPQQTRKEVRQHWYRGSVSEVEQYVYSANQVVVKTDVTFKTDDHLAELHQLIKTHLGDALSKSHDLKHGFASNDALASFNTINAIEGNGASLLAESTIIKVFDEDSNDMHFYTLLRHSAHSNISHLFGEEDRRLPNEDTLTIASGFMTSHPNAFMQVSAQQLPAFAKALSELSSAQEYKLLMDAYGVRRTNPTFWHFADTMHAYFQANYPHDFAYLDFNRLENR